MQGALKEQYSVDLVASGFVDDVSDFLALDPLLLRFSKGKYLCGHGNEADRLWVMVCGWPRYVTNTLIGATVNKAAQMEQIHAEDIADGGPMPGPVRIYFP